MGPNNSTAGAQSRVTFTSPTCPMPGPGEVSMKAQELPGPGKKRQEGRGGEEKREKTCKKREEERRGDNMKAY